MSDHDETTKVYTGFFPLVSGEAVDMQNSGAAAVLARGDMSLTSGGSSLMLAGGNITIQSGGGQTILARHDVSITQGGALLVGGARVSVNEGLVGVALGRHLELNDSRVLLGPVQALGMGAAFGVVAALLHRLLDRRGD